MMFTEYGADTVAGIHDMPLAIQCSPKSIRWPICKPIMK